MVNKNILVFARLKPPRNTPHQNYEIEQDNEEEVLTLSSGRTHTDKQLFRFHKIFPQCASQQEVFENVVRPVIHSVLSGYNGTIFAYGQTGSGKTFTMTGDFVNYDQRGIIPRTIAEIFRHKDSISSIAISYFEIYNEHGYDLIGVQQADVHFELPQVNMLEDSAGNIHFRNLSIHPVKTEEEAFELHSTGDSNRMVCDTVNNPRSSRSHTVFTIIIEVAISDNEQTTVRSKLHLVDLAGSERWSKTGSNISNPWETRYINLSLHYLEQVMVALGQPGRLHIPYRNSLVTAVLRDSLGGNCCTTMIATLSADQDDIEETLQTCRFGQRVALIKNDVRVNEVVDPQREIEVLKIENEQLKAQLELLSLDKLAGKLTESDKQECQEKVESFIEGSKVANLPLSHVKKSEYCFQLLRDKVVKLKQLPQTQQDESQQSNSQQSRSHSSFSLESNDQEPAGVVDVVKDEVKERSEWQRAMQKVRMHLQDQCGRQAAEGRCSQYDSKSQETKVRRMERNIINLPKVNVLYKDALTKPNPILVAADKAHNNSIHDLQLLNDDVNSHMGNAHQEPQHVTYLLEREEFVSHETDSISSQCATVTLFDVSATQQLQGATDTRIKRQTVLENLSRHYNCDDSVKLEGENVATIERKTNKTTRSDQYSGEAENITKFDGIERKPDEVSNGIVGDSENFARIESAQSAESSEQTIIVNIIEEMDSFESCQTVQSIEHVDVTDDDSMSNFSTSSLLLTGDAEIDEEIIKFYRKRYTLFKTK